MHDNYFTKYLTFGMRIVKLEKILIENRRKPV